MTLDVSPRGVAPGSSGRSRNRGPQCALTIAVRSVVLCSVALFAAVPLAASERDTAKAIFSKRCTACHYFGKGIKVGPDLKKVTERRRKEWLQAFIRSSSKMIGSGDPTATDLFRQFKQERMPDWTDLSTEQIGAIIDYLGANGPEQKEPDQRNALTATQTEIFRGRRLFNAELQLRSNGQACSTCHTIRDLERVSRGSLGPDLTKTYLKYQDQALTDYLKHPSPVHSATEFLAPQELFDIKAYMAQAAGLPIPAVNTQTVRSTQAVRSTEAPIQRVSQ